MVKRDKYFVSPPKDGRDFKELFRFAISAGTGLPVDKVGNPIGVWTPKSLAMAISEVDPEGRGTDIRSVQHWFQDNNKGINSENIYWLARVFGCGDPEATTEWRVELNAANRRLAVKRKAKSKGTEVKAASSASPEISAIPSPQTALNQKASASDFRTSLAQRTEAVYSSESSMALPLVVFTGACALALIAFTLNVHSVLYAAEGGTEKQVGFLWAPNWTIVFIALLPLFLAFLIELVRCWKEEWRLELMRLGDADTSIISWERRVRAASYTFWAVFFITVVVGSGYNWTATHLIPLLTGDAGSWPVDWGRIAIVRPDLISVPSAIGFSGLVFLYNGFAAYFFFAGHILLHLMKHDYLDLAKRLENRQDDKTSQAVQGIGFSLMYGIYRCTAVAVMITIMMKLQASFLQSGGSNVIIWLVDDFKSVFGVQSSADLGEWSFGIAPGFYFSFFCLLAIVGTFATASFKIRWMAARFETNQIGSRSFWPWTIMDGSMALLVISYFLIGALPGFSIFAFFALIVTGYLLIKPSAPWGQVARYERQT
ncbi:MULTISPECIES: RcgA family putative transporter [unclassified Sulfitobacter]|uniref:RcgA family putative transporter n=1 Tax=unclassified Sulfitobacter TaxID=196795 RepID=UPI00374581DA